MSASPYIIRACLTLVALGVLLALGAACKPGANITYVNNTTHKVRVYKSNHHFVADLNPSQERTFSTYKHLWTGGILAETRNGRVVFSVDLTWDELKAQDYRIVIEEQGVPTPTADESTPPSPEPLATPAAPG
jgi:hypothetical protein